MDHQWSAEQTLGTTGQTELVKLSGTWGNGLTLLQFRDASKLELT